MLIGSHDPADGMEGAVAHVFGDDEAAAEVLAREILDQMSVANAGESGVLEVNEYQLMGGGPDDEGDIRIARKRLEGGSSKWVLVQLDFVLSREGKWEPRPFFDKFSPALAYWSDDLNCLFDTPDEALRCWQTAVVRSVYDKPVQKQAVEQDDLGFLREIQERLTVGVEGRDPAQIEYAREMIRDWVDELEAEKRPSMEIARDLLLLVHEQEVDLGFLGNLTSDELEQVKGWAAAEHLAANDNDVDVPAMPSCLIEYFGRLASGGE